LVKIKKHQLIGKKYQKLVKIKKYPKRKKQKKQKNFFSLGKVSRQLINQLKIRGFSLGPFLLPRNYLNIPYSFKKQKIY
jgi:hypothetical protein